MLNHVNLIILLFLLLNIAGKSVAKYLDTSLDLTDNNEKWNSQKIQPGNKILKEGSPHKNDESHLNEENKILYPSRESDIVYMLKQLIKG